MDRPEWIDVRNAQLEVFVTLTNNSNRGRAGSPGVDAVNPRPNNVYGHVVRWRYAGDFDEPTFAWEIFHLAGDPAVPAHGSTINGDKYGSPDGLTPDSRTMFVGIQHPGERPDDRPGDPANPTEFSSFPGGPGSSRPRSSMIVVTKDDGGRSATSRPLSLRPHRLLGGPAHAHAPHPLRPEGEALGVGDGGRRPRAPV